MIVNDDFNEEEHSVSQGLVLHKNVQAMNVKLSIDYFQMEEIELLI